MENYSREIIDAIIEDFADDKELTADMLFYLYHTTTDNKMKENILPFFNENNICIQCGSKMTYYEWDEARPIGSETMSTYDCAKCGETKYMEGLK